MKNRLALILLLLLAMLSVGGCANQQPRRDFETGKKKLEQGQVAQGLAQIEQASTADPENIEYRQYLYKQREIAVNQILVRADAERSHEAFDEAVADYNLALSIDPNHPRAKAGLDLVPADKARQAQLAEATALFEKGNTELAMSKLRLVLAQNPKLHEARVLQKKIEEKSTEESSLENSPVIKSALKKTISLQFKDADFKSVFDVISRVSGLNFVFDKDIRAGLKATIFVKNTTIESAIRLLLVTNQMEQAILNENTLILYPDTPAKGMEYRQQIVKSFYLANADVKKTYDMIKAILKTKDAFVDEKRNMLVLRDTPEVIRLAEKLIATQDLPDPEVELEVEILEVNTARLTNLGLQFPQKISASVGNNGSFTQTQWENRNSDFLSYKVTDPAFTLNLQKTDSDTKLLANPRIRVKDKEKAKIHIGQRLPVLTTVSTAGVGSAETVSYIDVGLKLDVEPSIRLDDEVDMKVKLEVSSVNQTITLTSGTQVYQLGTRNAETVLRLQDGETQILAGLIQNSDTSSVSKVPGLGDVPLLGRLFSNDNSNNQKTDLVLLITPHVIRNMTRPDELASKFASGTDSSIGSAPPARYAVVPVSVDVVPAVPVKLPDPIPTASVSPPVPVAEVSAVTVPVTPEVTAENPKSDNTDDQNVTQ